MIRRARGPRQTHRTGHPPPDRVAGRGSVLDPAVPGTERAVRQPERVDDRGIGRSAEHDRTGSRLYYNLARAGSEVEVSGPGPMRVLLGNARDAVVELNGAAFDYQPFVRRGIARFTIGESIANASTAQDAAEPGSQPTGPVLE